MAGLTSYGAAAIAHARRSGVGALVRAALVLSIAVVVLAPLVLLIVDSFRVTRPDQAGDFTLEAWRIALGEPGIGRALINTVTLTAARQAVALVVAVCFAWLIARTDLPGRGWLEIAFWTVFFLPALPMTLGWILLLDPNFGLLNEGCDALFGLRPFNVYSWSGIVWVHLVTGTIAIKVVLLVPAFRNLDSSLEESSWICGVGTPGTLWRISVPLVLPAIVIVTLMAVATSLQAFEIELILGPQAGIDVYSTIMYRFVSQEPAQFGPATALGVLVMLGMIPFAIWQYRLVSRRSFTTVTGRNRATLIRLGKWRRMLFGTVMAYLVVALIVPTAFLLMGTFMKFFGAFDVADPWTLMHWRTVLTDATFVQSLGNTLLLGCGAAAVAVVWFSLAAYTIVRYPGPLARTLDFLCWLPWAIPGVIMGLGFLWTVLGVDVLRPLHSTMIVMILAVSLGAITPATQMAKASLLQIDQNLEGAGRVSGGAWPYMFRRIVLPMLTPTLVGIAIMTFVAATRDIGRIVFVVGGTNRPLSLLQLDLMVSERLEAAAVVGVIVTLLSLGVALAARLGGLRLAEHG